MRWGFRYDIATQMSHHALDIFLLAPKNIPPANSNGGYFLEGLAVLVRIITDRYGLHFLVVRLKN